MVFRVQDKGGMLVIYPLQRQLDPRKRLTHVYDRGTLYSDSLRWGIVHLVLTFSLIKRIEIAPKARQLQSSGAV